VFCGGTWLFSSHYNDRFRRQRRYTTQIAQCTRSEIHTSGAESGHHPTSVLTPPCECFQFGSDQPRTVDACSHTTLQVFTRRSHLYAFTRGFATAGIPGNTTLQVFCAVARRFGRASHTTLQVFPTLSETGESSAEHHPASVRMDPFWAVFPVDRCSHHPASVFETEYRDIVVGSDGHTGLQVFYTSQTRVDITRPLLILHIHGLY
jgi:hypothetical protein